MSTDDRLGTAPRGGVSSVEGPSMSVKNHAKTPEGNSTELSQSIVDEFFKDFISKKISKTSRSASSSKDGSKPGKVDEISKLLDLEISSIQAQTKESVTDINVIPNTHSQQNSEQSSSKDSFLSQRLSTELSDLRSQNITASIPLPPQKPEDTDSNRDTAPGSKLQASTNAVWSSDSVTSTNDVWSSDSVTNPTSSQGQLTLAKVLGPAGKKMNIPKQLGCMLSTESLSLIKSKDKIDRDGRVWEDGEVPSSHSENSNKEESDSDDGGLPSDTGSINSDKEDWKSKSSSSKHKKKHKHKHKKKKKKKSSKEREKTNGIDDDEKKNNHRKEREKDKGIKRDKEKERSSSKSSHKDKESEKVKKGDEGTKKEKDNWNEDVMRKEKGNDADESRKDCGFGDKDRSDSKKKEKEKKRKRDRSRSRSPKRSRRSRSRSKSPRKSRRSTSPRKSRHSEWDARTYGNDPKKNSKKTSRSRSRSGSRSRSKRKRSSDQKADNSKDQERDLRLRIDKAKLRKIAIANTLSTIKSGQPVPAQLDVAAAKSGGKSVEELTDFCKRISEKEQERHDNAISDSSEEEAAMPSDEEEPLIHHPFKVKDMATANIVMNIRNAKQLPVLTPSEKQVQQASLRLSFPVSSGSHHRASESEWVPVERTTAQSTPTTSKQTNSMASIESQPEPTKSIFPAAGSSQNVDIGAIISERLQAVRKLQANPYDVQALSSMHKAQQKASQWAQSKHLPGQFTGSTGAQVMSQQEILGDKRRQAWAKKTQFTAAAPVSGGIGMFLLQKMGWKQGEGLGKNQEGSTEPLQLDIKIDRKGLATAADNPKARPQVAHVPKAKDLSHKHPVSALMELCNKRRWGPPSFTIVSEDGPDHKKYFLFKVKVNNVEYQPAVPSSNKKTAKAQCAAVCLQEMGLIPRDAPMNY